MILLFFETTVVILELSRHHPSTALKCVYLSGHIIIIVRYKAELLLTAYSSCAANARYLITIIVLLIVVLLISAHVTILLLKLSHK